jgi:hypothetical protein
MSRHTELVSAEPIIHATSGRPLVGPDGTPILKRTWKWVENEPPPAPDPGVLGYDPADLKARYAAHQAARAAALRPKRYRLTFTYADGVEKTHDGGPDEARRNDEIGRTLHTEPLVGCRTALLKD